MRERKENAVRKPPQAETNVLVAHSVCDALTGQDEVGPAERGVCEGDGAGERVLKDLVDDCSDTVRVTVLSNCVWDW